MLHLGISCVSGLCLNRRKSATAVDGLKVPITEAPADGTSGARRATDANVLPEESFWDGEACPP